MSARDMAMSVVDCAPKADPLAALMERVAKADQKALADLYAQMNRKIFAFALRHVGDRDVAEGVVVETMFEVWKNAAKFGGRSRVSTWILGIARFKALDEVRRQARYSPLDDVATAAIEDTGISAYEGLAAGETSAQLKKCIARLPPEQQECIHLAFFEDLSLAEIAEIQGVPENTVKTRMFHARRKLKLMLSGHIESANDSG